MSITRPRRRLSEASSIWRVSGGSAAVSSRDIEIAHRQRMMQMSDSLNTTRNRALFAVPSWSSPEPAAGRVALVSGGNRGLGLEIVRMLAQDGMRVVLASRSVEQGQAAVELLGYLADRVAVRHLDVTDADSTARLASW